VARDGVVHLLATREAEVVATVAADRVMRLQTGFDSIGASWGGTPTEASVATDKFICDVPLIFELHLEVIYQLHYQIVLHEKVTAIPGTLNERAKAIIHDFSCKIEIPAVCTKLVPAFVFFPVVFPESKADGTLDLCFTPPSPPVFSISNF
jgi:hypothetical protein